MSKGYLEYDQQRTLDLSLRFDPRREFREIVDAVRSVRLPPTAVNDELIAFSVLELLSNSVRAHRERGIDEEVNLRYSVGEDSLSIEILDSGRGFDPSRLPYSLEDPPETVDTVSQRFTEYRAAYGNGRFGMGLLAARRTFPVFNLTFVDKTLQPCPWFSGLVRGTRIQVAAPLVSEESVEEFEELPPAEEAE